MARYVGHAVDQYGRDIPGAYVTVVAMDGDPATLTDDFGNPISQPLRTDDYGGYYFNTDDGLYTITTTRSGEVIAKEYNVVIGILPTTDGFQIALAAEASARVAGDTLVAYNANVALQAEITRAISAEQSETARATLAEGALDARITTNTNDITGLKSSARFGDTINYQTYALAIADFTAYNSATAYTAGKRVIDQGALWTNILGSTNVPPPTLPTTSNANWILKSNPVIGTPIVVPITDTETHTDPTNGATVNNTGIHEWTVGASGTGFHYLFPTDAALAKPYADAAAASATAAAASAAAAAASAVSTRAYVENDQVGNGLITSQPNLFTQNQLDFTDTTLAGQSAGLIYSVATVAGIPGLSFATPVASMNSGYWQFNKAALFPGATTISASFCVMSLDASSAGSARVLIQQMNSSGTEITAARTVIQIVTDGSAITGPKHFPVNPSDAQNIALDPACTDVRFYVEVTTGSSGARALVIRDMLLAKGGNAAPRRPPITAATLGITSATDDIDDIASQLPNAFTNDELDVIAFRNISGGTLSKSTYGTGKRPCWAFSVAAGGSGNGPFFGGIARADVDNGSGVFSFNIHIYSFDAVVGGSNLMTGRFLVIQRNSSGVEISGTRTTITLPAAGVLSPKWNPYVIPLDGATATIWVYCDITNNSGTNARSIKFGDFLLAAGDITTFRRRPVIGGSGGSAVTVSKAGPVTSLQAAINAGYAVIDLANDVYGTEQRVDPTTIPPTLKIIGQRGAGTAYDSYPVIKLASPITGWTKTSGFSNVYQKAIAGLPTNANFNWGYFDGVADPRCVIAVGQHYNEHRGRTNRLPWTTKVIKTTATTVSAACAEIDAAGSSDPRAFIDDANGILYRYGTAGDADNFVLDAAVGLFSSATRESCGSIEVQGIIVMYGGADFTPFRKQHLDEFFSIGSQNNAIDYSVLSYGTVETACAGSMSGQAGDGLNGHKGAKLVSGNSLYSHDNRDDGWSDHEGCSSRMKGGGLCEYNGGTALAPAFGSDHESCFFIGINNCLAGFKAGQFAVVGAPSASTNGPDGGYDTNATFKYHLSIGGPRGFHDDGAANSCIARTIGCVALDYVQYGFNTSVSPINCYATSATGSPRSPGTPTPRNVPALT